MGNSVFFREDLIKGKADGIVLVGNKCRKCGKVFFPKADFCNQCLSLEMEEAELSRRGILYSYTITRVPVGKFPIPHPIGMITIPEDKVRIVAPLVPEEEYSIGAEMEMVAAPLWTEEDKVIMGYKFRTVRKDWG
jgi:uncharacterized protein